MTLEEKHKFNEVLKVLMISRVDCRQFINLKIVFINEDKDGRGLMTEEEFRSTFRKSVKKCHMQKALEDAVVDLLLNEDKVITFQSL